MYNEDLKWVFTDKEIKILANYVINHKISLRKLSEITNISKSTLHRIFHKKLPNIDFKKYEELQAALEKNFAEKHIRGGESTKKKFDDLKNRK